MDPYSTHLPVLRMLGKILKPRRVIEIGSGIYSTGCFLDREYYPDLEYLYSTECNYDWFNRISGAFKDSRAAFKQEAELTTLGAIPTLPTFDMAFIDGQESNMRIKFALAAKAIAPVIVMHDADLYSAAWPQFKHHFVYKDLSPWTAVLSDTLDVSDMKI